VERRGWIKTERISKTKPFSRFTVLSFNDDENPVAIFDTGKYDFLIKTSSGGVVNGKGDLS
jgi:hypothetical protein